MLRSKFSYLESELLEMYAIHTFLPSGNGGQCSCSIFIHTSSWAGSVWAINRLHL